MGKRIEENQEALKMIHDLMTKADFDSMSDDEKTQQITRLLLVDMSINLAIIADTLLEGKE